MTQAVFRPSPSFEELAMREERMTADRVAAFSDAVFAVIMTIMVLDLKAPDGMAFSDLWPQWQIGRAHV